MRGLPVTFSFRDASGYARVTDLPGIGPRRGARGAVEVGDIRRFKTPARLAAYAGLGPTPRQSGTSIRLLPLVASLAEH